MLSQHHNWTASLLRPQILWLSLSELSPGYAGLLNYMYNYIVHTHLKTLARAVAKLGLPNDTSMALPLSGARAANPSTVPRIVLGRAYE